MRFTHHRAAALGSVTLAASLALSTAPAAVAAQAGASSPGSPRLTSALGVAISENTATVNRDGSVSLTGTYTCADTAGTRMAQLHIHLTAQNNAVGSTDVSVPCQVGSGHWSATVAPAAGSPARFAKDVPAQAHVTLAPNGTTGQRATDEAILLARTLHVTTDPVVTANSDGSSTLSGTYGCSADTPTVNLDAQLTKDTATEESVGVAVLQLACPAVNQPWSATINHTARQAVQRAGSGGEADATVTDLHRLMSSNSQDMYRESVGARTESTVD
jgi:hypothetical protein